MAARTRQALAVQQHLGPAPMTPYGLPSAGVGGGTWAGGGPYGAAAAGQGFQPGLGSGAALGGGGVSLAQQLGGLGWAAAPAQQGTLAPGAVAWPAAQGHAAAPAAPPACSALLQARFLHFAQRGRGNTARSAQQHKALHVDMLGCVGIQGGPDGLSACGPCWPVVAAGGQTYMHNYMSTAFTLIKNSTSFCRIRHTLHAIVLTSDSPRCSWLCRDMGWL